MDEPEIVGEDKAALRGALQRWVLCILLGVVTFFGFAFFYLRAGYLYDADSYVHLAVARLYAEEGLVRGLPWPRFSVMHEQYGDKELLFHVALMPLVMVTDAAVAGRVALALFNAGLVTLLALLFTRHLGLLGLAVPWWLLAASPPFLNRVIRLRPEILGLILFLLAAAFFIRKRWIALGIVALLYPLSYTAFHVLAGLVAIWVGLEWLRTRTFEWKPLVATGVGIVAGNLIHPHPIDHMEIWWLQNVSYFRWKGIVAREEEILPPSWQEVLFVNGGWWILAIAVLALILVRLRKFPIDRRTIVYGSTAVLFLLLYLRMGRMVLYAIPFLALTLSAALDGLQIGKRWGTAFVALALIAIPVGLAFDMQLEFFDRTIRGVEDSSERELEQLGRAVPREARIAASWGDTQLYAFWAPQGRYLNMYDPLFMAVKDRKAFDAFQAILAGRVHDIPPVLTGTLRSEFLAIQTPWDNPALSRVLEGDPRWRVRHQGANVLLELRKPENGTFLTRWDVRASDGSQLRWNAIDPWRAMVGVNEDGCHQFEAPLACNGCSLDVRSIGRAVVSLDGEPAREIRSPDQLSPWTAIENVRATSIAVEQCGPAGSGFFVFQR